MKSNTVGYCKTLFFCFYDWDDCAFAFTVGCNGALRGASSRSLNLSDLNLSRGFGPERSGPWARCMMYVLRKGDQHKERHDTDQQVGVWRHRCYLLCPVFATAMKVIYLLRRRSELISFE